jgi:hypothetical protein
MSVVAPTMLDFGRIVMNFFLFIRHNSFSIHGAVEVIDLFLGKQQVLHAVYLHSA